MRAGVDCGPSYANVILGRMKKLEGAALITGASAGLGHALCHRFGQAKINVIAVARRRDMLEALCADLTQLYGTQNYAICADLSTTQGVGDLVRQIDKRSLIVDYLVNNAGVAQQGSFESLDPQRELATISVNVSALVQLCRVFAPRMIARGAGHMLNISSTASFQPGPFMSTYYASKAFVSSFSEGIYHELKSKGVRVTAVCPGPIHTEFAKSAGIENSNLFHSRGIADPQRVADASFAAMLKGRRKVVIGSRNKLLALGSRLGPKSVILRVAGHLNQEHRN